MTTYLLKVATNGSMTRIAFDKAKSYDQLSNAVGGYLEAVPCPNNGGHDLYCNEEGKLEGLPLNPVMTRFWRARLATDDFLVGDCVFANCDEEGETLGLTAEECDALEAQLKAA